jgi:hypothetical protein
MKQNKQNKQKKSKKKLKKLKRRNNFSKIVVNPENLIKSDVYCSVCPRGNKKSSGDILECNSCRKFYCFKHASELDSVDGYLICPCGNGSTKSYLRPPFITIQFKSYQERVKDF